MSHTAYIYDAVRTPRSKGKAGGALHEVKPIELGTGLLRELQTRHNLDTSYVDDVIMGCVAPVGEQGGDIGKMIAINADWDDSVAGMQLDRFCASGLEAVNSAAAKIAAGWENLVVAGGIECMSRVPMGSSGGAMDGDAAFTLKSGFVPQGIGASRPRSIEPGSVNKVGVLGAGMMGQGIAYVSAMAGIEVVLKDISLDVANKGKAYAEALLAKRVARGRMSEEKKAAILGLILPTEKDTDLQGCDLIIEAVFENMALKHKITRATEACLTTNVVWGSNTSSLPITQLAEASSRPENFIGIHFFSPVDKMPLVEIICGEKTSDETLARAFDYTRQINKTPIEVNDSMGFFTSRTFATYLDEGVHLLREGVHTVQIDHMGKAIGMPLGPLAVFDEVSLELTRKAQQTWRELGMLDKFGDQSISSEVVNTLVGEYGRGGRHHGGGFLQFMETYGYRRFVERCNELAAIYGERFLPPQIALVKAAV
jgi:3-hydroxyacyl-CoA dehydrogenase